MIECQPIILNSKTGEEYNTTQNKIEFSPYNVYHLVDEKYCYSCFTFNKYLVFDEKFYICSNPDCESYDIIVTTLVNEGKIQCKLFVKHNDSYFVLSLQNSHLHDKKRISVLQTDKDCLNLFSIFVNPRTIQENFLAFIVFYSRVHQKLVKGDYQIDSDCVECVNEIQKEINRYIKYLKKEVINLQRLKKKNKGTEK